VPHVELADHRPGTGWLVARVRELSQTYRGAKFAAFAAGPVKSWVPALSEVGVELEMLPSTETPAACSNLQKLVAAGGLSHAEDPVLSESLRTTKTRDLDGGAWVWDWKHSEGDPAPIVAATGAVWKLTTQPAYDLLASVY
jgi:hypothetical protein